MRWIITIIIIWMAVVMQSNHKCIVRNSRQLMFYSHFAYSILVQIRWVHRAFTKCQNNNMWREQQNSHQFRSFFSFHRTCSTNDLIELRALCRITQIDIQLHLFYIYSSVESPSLSSLQKAKFNSIASMIDFILSEAIDTHVVAVESGSLPGKN